jgi:hypothetical protein
VNPFARSLIVAALTFASGLFGFFLHWLLPAQRVADARGMIGSIIGLVTLMLALVLGLLIWASYGVYSHQNEESQSLGPLILKLDFAFEQYGPEARRGRDLLRAAVIRGRGWFWGEGDRSDSRSPYAQLRADLLDITTFFDSLEPVTDQQKQLIVTAMPNFLQAVETTVRMSRQLANPVPKLLIFVVIGWSALLFMSYGLLGAFNALSVVAAALGSVAVASAMFVILEFSQPYSGLFGISPVGVDDLIAALSR